MALRKNPIVTVRGLGKLKEASIELKPMLFFVGPNNSGKTYLMTMLYCLSMIGFDNASGKFYIEVNEGKKDCAFLYECIKKLKEKYVRQKEECELVFDKELITQVEQLINGLLDENKNRFIQYAFGSNSMSIDSLEIKFPEIDTFLIKLRAFPDNEMSPIAGFTYQKRLISFAFKSELFSSDNFDVVDMMVKAVLQYFFSCVVDNGSSVFSRFGTYYLPASRTGFLLTYQSVFNDVLEKNNAFVSDDEEKRILQYTRPTVDFLKFLNNEAKFENNEKYKDIIGLLNDKVIDGTIKKDTTGYSYSPKNRLIDLKMYLSSGVVTETTPLITALSRNRHINTLFIEEPEICLHPKYQHVMARCLIRLMKKGTRIISSTHSDIIIQHLNNMIKLGYTKSEELKVFLDNYGYDRDDILGIEDIGVYQFELLERQKTSIVRAIVPDEYGFGIPVFNDEFAKILDESRRISELIGE